ncbi:Sulfurtransferase TusE [Buchnera aphidicola (Pterocallis alni)]|uniref:TusE/DsrC/DsvC family sulfur relay protein n=1 Tax=Buchnera aphidicola TaxID=9 RepID=UPI003464E2B9
MIIKKKNKILKIWNTNIALKIAQLENITMTNNHWEIIHLIRNLYITYNIIPPNRMLLKIIKKKLGIEKSNNKYLLSLFPKGLVQQANKIAGLPKTNICL